MVQSGYDLLAISDGKANAVQNSQAGFQYTALEYQTLAYSPAFTSAACAFIAFGSNYSTVDAYLTTESSLESMLTSRVG